VAFVTTEYRYSERQACKLLDLDRASYRYEARPDRNLELRQQLVALARQKPRFGYRRLWYQLTRNRPELSMSRVYRLYRKEHLSVRRIARKKLRTGAAVNALLKRPNQEWALDFMSDALATGRAIRLLTMVDGFTRECPAIEVAPSLSSRRVTRVLDRVIAQRGAPVSLRCDNGPEFTSRHFLQWCEERQIKVVHIQPGKPMQKAYASYCASLEHSGMTDDTSRRDESFIPCAFLGASPPGGSYRCSGLSVQA
jgi:putative transposase